MPPRLTDRLSAGRRRRFIGRDAELQLFEEAQHPQLHQQAYVIILAPKLGDLAVVNAEEFQPIDDNRLVRQRHPHEDASVGGGVRVQHADQIALTDDGFNRHAMVWKCSVEHTQ